ncbi:hypothetical protein Scep_026558 [Stephania cephalantha]|uniref:Uncharacterized protein n=1 Tax=Stephania cephalantha TaxID=152367 RepID=A0AAP0EKS4_9MAGN
MICTGRVLSIPSSSTTPLICHRNPAFSKWSSFNLNLKCNLRWRSMASQPESSSIDADSLDKNPAPGCKPHTTYTNVMFMYNKFCIIEGPETVQDFAKMELREIQDNIRSRRNKVFLLMEEVRRLRIQQRIKNAELGISLEEQENDLPNFPSFIPFLPDLSSANLKKYYATCFSLIAGIIIFGGLLAPTLELKLGLGGTSYEDFIRSVHLPLQLRTPVTAYQAILLSPFWQIWGETCGWLFEDILLAHDVPARDLSFLSSQWQLLTVAISLYHLLKQKDVQTVQEQESDLMTDCVAGDVSYLSLYGNGYGK